MSKLQPLLKSVEQHKNKLRFLCGALKILAYNGTTMDLPAGNLTDDLIINLLESTKKSIDAQSKPASLNRP